MSADYSHANDVSLVILTSIMKEPIGYGIMGCALTIGRLANPDVHLLPTTETQFVGDLMEWVGEYFTIDVKGGLPN